METILRRHLWALDVLVLTIVAIAAARATAHAVDSALLHLSAENGAAAAPARVLVTPTSDRRDDVINRRNIFCSACRPRSSAPRTDEAAPPAGAPSLTLVAIMYAPPPNDSRWSVAVLKDARGAVGAYTVGSSIGGAIVEGIDQLRVHLRMPDGYRWALALLGGAEQPPRAPNDPLVAEMDAGIRKIAENRYDVSRSTIESLLGKMGTMAPPAHLEPDVRGGKPVGFRLRDVRAGGPFARIGLRDGDVISSVNGLATNGPDNALAIYASLRSVDHLSVALERDGRRITTEYDIE